MVKLSVVISAYNEEKKIEECLKSALFADEIILVDNSSTDNTAKITKKYTSRVFIRPNKQMLNSNKNYGFSRAEGDWILSLDADERISPELKEEIKSTIEQSNNETISGFWIPRKNIIFGKWIKHAGWYPDYQLRLMRRGKGKFPEEHVHEMIKISGETRYLNKNIVHYNYETIFQFVDKLINIYALNEAEQRLKKGYKFVWQDAIRMPIKEFLSRFFAREGYKDGFHGLMLSILMAFYHFIIFAIIWEKRGFKQIDGDRFLEDTEKEFRKSYKELLFWNFSEKIKTIKNPIKKTLLRLVRQFN